MIDRLLNLIKAYYPLKEKDVDSFKSFDLNGMSVETACFNADGLGSVSILKATNQMMNMDTLIISPIYRDLALFSYDRIKAFGNDNILLELYDILLNDNFDNLINKLNIVLDKYSDIKNEGHDSKWYDSILLPTSINKKGSVDLKERFDSLEYEYLNEYLKDSLFKKDCDISKKKEKCLEYCNNLLKYGGPSTDAFIKAKGKEFTEELFHKVMFNVDQG